MAEHVWTVLCYRASVDKHTNNISLLNVMEQMRFIDSEEELQDRIESQAASGLHTDMELVSYWVRSDFGAPESRLMRVRLKMPSGQEIDVVRETPVKLQDTVGYRLRFQITGIPFQGFGVYWFQVQGQVRGGRWKTATRVPLHLHRVNDGEKATPKALEEEPGQP